MTAVAVACIAIGAFLILRPKFGSKPENDGAPTITKTNSETEATQGKPADVSTGAAMFSASEPMELPDIPGVEKNRFDRMVRGVAQLEDPALDGWDTETFNEIATKQLKAIGKLIGEATAKAAQLDSTDFNTLASDSFTSNGLRPKNLQSTYSDGTIVVRRGDTTDSKPVTGPDGLRNVIKSSAEPLADTADHRYKFKIIRVNLDKETKTSETKAYFEFSGRTKERATQINSVWNCKWSNADPKHPLLESIEVEDYEEVDCMTPNGGSMFVDCTESVFRDTDRFERQLRFGIDYWIDQFDGAIARPAAGHGMAIDDVNGDGLEDVYLCQSPALPNLLLLQNPDGTVRDAAVESEVHWLEGTRAALLADLDNDGDQDLVSVLGSYVVIQANDGKGKFTEVTTIEAVSSLFAINAVDYDNDRDLDLFICGYTLTTGINPNDVFANPMPFHDANNGATNIMLRNDGGWGFTDVTADIGLDQNTMRFSYASSWDDFDNDGDQDLYVSNDFGRNNLYRNDDGKFKDVAPELDVEDIGPGMSASWGDYNNDGRPDLYVSNMFSSAGNRITHQERFKTNLDDTTKGFFRRHARGNSLFENMGGGRFKDVSIDKGVTLGRWAWGSLFVDINNDGWEDLYVANGFVTADDTNDL